MQCYELFNVYLTVKICESEATDRPHRDGGTEMSEILMCSSSNLNRHELFFFRSFLNRESQLGGGFICFIFIPIPGEMIQFDEHIFQMGLVQPPTSQPYSSIFQAWWVVGG